VQHADAQLVFLFVRTRCELDERMPPAVAALGPASAIWVFFRKGSRDAGLNMNRSTVWAVAETLNMRPLGLVGINDTWSAFRLRRASSVRSRSRAATDAACRGLRASAVGKMPRRLSA
jgi:hypothetical protein